VSWFRPASGCSRAGSVRKEDTSVAAVDGSKGVGVKESRLESSPEAEESCVGGEVDLRPVRVSHLGWVLVLTGAGKMRDKDGCTSSWWWL
jgi:hypothetical protein